MSATSVGRRVALGPHLAGDVPDMVLTLTDRYGVLDKRLTRSLERMLAIAVDDSRSLELINATPKSDHLVQEEYDRLRLLVSQFLLACRHAGIAFTDGPTCRLMAGPRAEPRRIAGLYVTERPPGIIHRLHAASVTAYASSCDDGSWILLAGSEVRIRTVQSASSTPATLRAEWLHAGIAA